MVVRLSVVALFAFLLPNSFQAFAEAALDMPFNIRAGRLEDNGKIRLSWTRPDAATNVVVRVRKVGTAGGLADVAESSFLFRESFTNAPATASNIKIDTESKLSSYTDKGADVWDVDALVQTYLATDAGAIKVGATRWSGTLASKPLGLAADAATLVVRAKHGNGDEKSGVLLNAAILSSAGETNLLGRVTLENTYAEKAFPLQQPLVATDSLLLFSEIASPKDGRVVLDEIALVSAYAPEALRTNEVTRLNIANKSVCDLSLDDGVSFLIDLCAESAEGTSAWTTPLAFTPETLKTWKERTLTLDKKGRVEAVFPLADLIEASSAAKVDVSDSPFRFLINKVEQSPLTGNKDIDKVQQVGVYVCTNVFSRDWIVLIPPAADTKADCEEAELRVAIDTGAFTARHLRLSGSFAQLRAKNTDARSLLFQWRVTDEDGVGGDWTEFGAFTTTFTAASVDPDFAATVTDVTAETILKVPKSARIEARILNQKLKDQKEAPLGFRDIKISVESKEKPFCLVIQ